MTSYKVGPFTCSSMVVSGLTASLPVVTDSSKNFTSATVTGTGTTVVMQGSPTITNPSIGVAQLDSFAQTGTTGNTFVFSGFTTFTNGTVFRQDVGGNQLYTSSAGSQLFFTNQTLGMALDKVGQTLTVTGYVKSLSTTASVSTSTGSIVGGGGLGISGDGHFGGSGFFGGNLTIGGSTSFGGAITTSQLNITGGSGYNISNNGLNRMQIYANSNGGSLNLQDGPNNVPALSWLIGVGQDGFVTTNGTGTSVTAANFYANTITSLGALQANGTSTLQAVTGTTITATHIVSSGTSTFNAAMTGTSTLSIAGITSSASVNVTGGDLVTVLSGANTARVLAQGSIATTDTTQGGSGVGCIRGSGGMWLAKDAYIDGYVHGAGGVIGLGGFSSNGTQYMFFDTGTWTPKVYQFFQDGTTSEAGSSYGYSQNVWTKIGNVVTVSMNLNYAKTTTTATSAVCFISDLPYPFYGDAMVTSSADSNFTGLSNPYYMRCATAGTTIHTGGFADHYTCTGNEIIFYGANWNYATFQLSTVTNQKVQFYFTYITN
jgi:hypothetical protein